jgi:hypothetical protein
MKAIHYMEGRFGEAKDYPKIVRALKANWGHDPAVMLELKAYQEGETSYKRVYRKALKDGINPAEAHKKARAAGARRRKRVRTRDNALPSSWPGAEPVEAGDLAAQEFSRFQVLGPDVRPLLSKLENCAGDAVGVAPPWMVREELLRRCLEDPRLGPDARRVLSDSVFGAAPRDNADDDDWLSYLPATRVEADDDWASRHRAATSTGARKWRVIGIDDDKAETLSSCLASLERLGIVSPGELRAVAGRLRKALRAGATYGAGVSVILDEPPPLGPVPRARWPEGGWPRDNRTSDRMGKPTTMKDALRVLSAPAEYDFAARCAAEHWLRTHRGALAELVQRATGAPANPRDNFLGRPSRAEKAAAKKEAIKNLANLLALAPMPRKEATKLARRLVKEGRLDSPTLSDLGVPLVVHDRILRMAKDPEYRERFASALRSNGGDVDDAHDVARANPYPAPPLPYY